MLLTTLLLISSPAPASPVVSTSAKRAEKLICRNEYEAHSRIPKRVCGTQADWESMYKDTQNDIRSSRNHRGTAPNGAQWY